MCQKANRKHWVKSVRIRSFSGPYFPAFRLKTERCGVSPGFDLFRADIPIYCNTFQYSATFPETLKWTGQLARNESIVTTSSVSFQYYSVSLNETSPSGPFNIALMTYIQFYQNLNEWDKSGVVICGKYHNHGLTVSCVTVKSSEDNKHERWHTAHKSRNWSFCDVNSLKLWFWESFYLNLLNQEKSWGAVIRSCLRPAVLMRKSYSQAFKIFWYLWEEGRFQGNYNALSSF